MLKVFSRLFFLFFFFLHHRRVTYWFYPRSFLEPGKFFFLPLTPCTARHCHRRRRLLSQHLFHRYHLPLLFISCHRYRGVACFVYTEILDSSFFFFIFFSFFTSFFSPPFVSRKRRRRVYEKYQRVSFRSTQIHEGASHYYNNASPHNSISCQTKGLSWTLQKIAYFAILI